MSALRCATTCLMVHSRLKVAHKLFSFQVVRGVSRWKFDYLTELHKRRRLAGPEKERHTSEYGIWNYDCEIFAFGKRLGEDFNETKLKQAFITSEYIDKERKDREALGMKLAPLEIEDNVELAEKGEKLATRYIRAYLRATYPHIFEEGICTLSGYLMSDEVLYHIASHLGLRDLIKSQDFPPTQQEHIQAFKAVIGALAASQDMLRILKNKGSPHILVFMSVERAEVFVRDFIISHLVSKDINEIWEIQNPMGLLTTYLRGTGQEPPEPRLLWQSGSGTVMSLYHVGIYSNKKLIGKSPGETVSIAEEMAARNALKNIMKTQDNRSPMQFHNFGSDGQFNKTKENLKISDVEHQTST